MAFEVTKKSYRQLDPVFSEGYPYPDRYHNMGQLMTPYEGKRMGQVGDYGPVQATQRYTPQNPTSVYPLDAYSNASLYLPTEGNYFCGKKGYYPCRETEYPNWYVPGNYFSPVIDDVNMGKVPGVQRFDFWRQGTQPNLHLSRKESYNNRNGTFDYRRLPTTPGPRIKYSPEYL